MPHLNISLDNKERAEVTDSCMYENRHILKMNVYARISTKLAQPMPKGKAMNGYKQEKDITKRAGGIWHVFHYHWW